MSVCCPPFLLLFALPFVFLNSRASIVMDVVILIYLLNVSSEKFKIFIPYLVRYSVYRLLIFCVKICMTTALIIVRLSVGYAAFSSFCFCVFTFTISNFVTYGYYHPCWWFLNSGILGNNVLYLFYIPHDDKQG